MSCTYIRCVENILWKIWGVTLNFVDDYDVYSFSDYK